MEAKVRVPGACKNTGVDQPLKAFIFAGSFIEINACIYIYITIVAFLIFLFIISCIH